MKKIILAIFLFLFTAPATAETFKVGAAVNDALGITGGQDTNFYTSTVNEFGRDAYIGDRDLCGYVRYALTIPPEATIDSAYFRFYSQTGAGNDTGAFNTTVYLLDLSSSPAWKNGNAFNTTNYADGSALDAISTSTSAGWSISGVWTTNTWYNSPSLATLLQAAIDSEDYDIDSATDKHVGFKVDHGDGAYTTGINTDRRLFDSYEEQPATSPQLIVTWTVAGSSSAKVGECADCDEGSMDDAGIWVYPGAEDKNYGASTNGGVGKVVVYTAKQIYRFDLSGLAAGSTVATARLGFYCSALGADGGVNVVVWGIHDNNNNWVEGVGTGQTADDPTDENCWNWLGYNETTWAGAVGLATSGTDYYATSYGAANATTTGAKEIFINEAGRTYIEGKMGGDGAEFLLWTTDTLDDNEYSTVEFGESATAAYRPYLELLYVPPPPSPPASQIIIIRR